jgi:hypothetical protein
MKDSTVEELKSFLKSGGYKTTRQCQAFVDGIDNVSRVSLLKTLKSIAEKGDNVPYLGTTQYTWII